MPCIEVQPLPSRGSRAIYLSVAISNNRSRHDPAHSRERVHLVRRLGSRHHHGQHDATAGPNEDDDEEEEDEEDEDLEPPVVREPDPDE